MTDAARPEPSDGADRLERALEAFLAGENAGADLLRDNPDLRDLLEPMLEADSARTAGSAEAQSPSGSEVDARREPRLGEFRNLREIGRGSTGVVYAADQVSLSRKVALKVLPGGTALDPSLVHSFRREAAAAASLEHPGIVKIHALGGSEHEHWIAMELVPGGTLRERLAEVRGRGTATCVGLIATVAEALHHAHAKGVVHCDVKPANILLRDDLSPVLTDFGLARRTGSPAASTVHGFAGTPYYASPEQVRGKAPDARSDVFSLGATLFLLLTGQRPFPGETTEEVLEKIDRAPTPDPKRIDERIPDDLCAIVLKALEKSPAVRYQSALELAADLRAFLAHAPVSARRPSPGRRLVRWTRREPLRAGLVAALAAVAVVGTYLVARIPAIRAGERVTRERAIDALLSEALQSRHLGATKAALATLERGVADHPESEDILADLVFTIWQGQLGLGPLGQPRSGSQREALERLRASPLSRTTSRALRRLEASLLIANGDPTAGAAAEKELGEPSSPLEFYVRGKILSNGSDANYDVFGREALDSLRRAVLASERPRAALAYEYALAVHLFGPPTAARDVETLILAHWPDSAVSWYWISIAHMHSAPSHAELAANRAIALDPKSALAHRGLGGALWMQRRYPESEQALLRAVELAPRCAGFWASLAGTYLGWARYDKALECATKAVGLDPDLLPAKVANVLARFRLGDLAAADAALAPLLADYGHSLEVKSALGSLRLAQGRAAEAILPLRQVVDSRPWSDNAWFELGTALYLQGERDEAERCFSRSLEIWPEHAQALVNLGILESETGRRGAGIARLRLALQHDAGIGEAWRSLAGMLHAEQDWAAFDAHVEAWARARPGDAAPRILKAQRILDAAGFDPGADGDRALELVGALPTTDPSERLEAACVELKVLAARRDPAAALKKLAEAKALAAAAGLGEDQVRARFAADETRVLREARRAGASRPASTPASGRER